jgi:nitrogen fixation protein NifU and related proteins
MSTFYSDAVLDHYRHPRNFGSLEQPDAAAEDANTLCGDDIRVELGFDRALIVREVRFSGKGCAISRAATSMLTEKVKGMAVRDISRLSAQIVLDNIGMSVTSTRMRCALLGLEVLKSAAMSKLEVS